VLDTLYAPATALGISNTSKAPEVSIDQNEIIAAEDMTLTEFFTIGLGL
jgi:hypothetical protein